MKRTVVVFVEVAVIAVSLVFIVGVFAGWWPYLWWEAFR